MTVSTSALDDRTLAQWRAEAAANASPSVNPAVLRDAETLMHLANDRWLSRILGRPVAVPAWHFFSNAELDLAIRAIRADRVHLEAAKEAQRAEWRRADDERHQAEAAAAQARWDDWETLRARLPVPVTVGHNWTARHLDPYVQGADHIVVQADLHAGRFHRDACSPLCWTPSRSHELRHVELSDDGENRIPDCKACLRHAERLAGQR